jgi:hypothetical protein
MERWLVWLVEVSSPVILPASTSIVYFITSPRRQPRRLRLLASAHGATIATIYALAWLIVLSGMSRPPLLLPFAVLLIVPVSLTLISFFIYKGPRAVHWLQVPSIACLLWTGFAGAMLVTGQSP